MRGKELTTKSIVREKEMTSMAHTIEKEMREAIITLLRGTIETSTEMIWMIVGSTKANIRKREGEDTLLLTLIGHIGKEKGQDLDLGQEISCKRRGNWTLMTRLSKSLEKVNLNQNQNSPKMFKSKIKRLK